MILHMDKHYPYAAKYMTFSHNLFAIFGFLKQGKNPTKELLLKLAEDIELPEYLKEKYRTNVLNAEYSYSDNINEMESFFSFIQAYRLFLLDKARIDRARKKK